MEESSRSQAVLLLAAAESGPRHYPRQCFSASSVEDRFVMAVIPERIGREDGGVGPLVGVDQDAERMEPVELRAAWPGQPSRRPEGSARSREEGRWSKAPPLAPAKAKSLASRTSADPELHEAHRAHVTRSVDDLDALMRVSFMRRVRPDESPGPGS